MLYTPTMTGVQPCRCLIYLRISRDDQHDGLGVDRQLEDAHGWCEAHDIPPEGRLIYRDNDRSSTNGDERPEFARLLNDIAGGIADGQIVWAWMQDRLVRLPWEFETVTRLHSLHNFHFIGFADPVHVVPGGSWLAPRVKSAVNYEVIRDTRTKLLRKLEQNRKMGVRHGKVPFGWNADGTAKPSEAPFVKELVEDLLAGKALTHIALDWQTRGVPMPTWTRREHNGHGPEGEVVNRPWDTQGLRRLARRASNAGLIVLPEGGTVPGTFDALVSEKQWRGVVGLLDSRTRPRGMTKHELSGLIDCGGCGEVASVCGQMIRQKGRPEVRRYRCRVCGSNSHRAEPIEELVASVMVERLTDPDFTAVLGSAQGQALAAASVTLNELRARVAGLGRLFADGTLDEAGVREGKAALARPLAEAERSVERLTDGRAGAVIALAGPDAALRWAAAGRDRQRAAVAALLSLTLVPQKRGKPSGDVRDRLTITGRTL